MEWLVELVGDQPNLEEIRKQCSGGKYQVTVDEGQFYLASPYFENLDNPSRVREEAEKIVELINGASALAIGLLRPIEISRVVRIRDDGKKDTFVAVSKTLTILWAVDSSTKPNAQEFLELAEKDPMVAQTLKIINKNIKMDYYPLLYNLFEIVQGDMGSKITEMRWTSKKEIERFCATAQSPEILGLEARHAIPKKHQPPKNPMFLREAQHFIRELLLKWLKYKWEQYRTEGTE